MTYVSGDSWNVNPVALKWVERLFCRNERAVLRLRFTSGGHPVALVPVAAILAAGIRLHFLDVVMNMNYFRCGRNRLFDARATGRRAGLVRARATIIVFAPRGFRLCDGIADGTTIRMGQSLKVLP